jgi:hypothetical protein
LATITKRGDAWRVQVRMRGEKRWLTCSTEAEAIAWGEAEEARIKQGRVGAAAPVPVTAPGLTVADLFRISWEQGDLSFAPDVSG